MNQKQPYVRFFASDWLAGTRGMKASEVGVYITLVALMYERCEPLPEDHRRLARQCGCTPKALSGILELLIEDGKIERTDAGLWNKRVQKEFDFRAENSTQSRKAAKKRWGKANENNGPDMPTQCERNAGGMPNHIPEARDTTTLSSAHERGSFLPADWEPTDTDRMTAGTHWPAERINSEIENFRTYYRQATDERSRSRDWSATWRMWVRRGIEREARDSLNTKGGRNGKAQHSGDRRANDAEAGISSALSRLHADGCSDSYPDTPVGLALPHKQNTG